ncbi:MAG: hypothetical protein KDJ65_14790, partial [Anaerolineae bacterium]|nr:hypothetical protein [Anaerolineae bacterium]
NERKARLERDINDYNSERGELLGIIGQRALTDEEIQDILSFSAVIREELEDVDGEADTFTKHKILELLNVQVLLEVKEGQKLYHARCYLGEQRKPTGENSVMERTTSDYPPESFQS